MKPSEEGRAAGDGGRGLDRGAQHKVAVKHVALHLLAVLLLLDGVGALEDGDGVDEAVVVAIPARGARRKRKEGSGG
jgi:hypothetical protein